MACRSRPRAEATDDDGTAVRDWDTDPHRISTETYSLSPQWRMAQAVELIVAQQLASGLAIPILVVDARGDALFINEPAEAIFGLTFSEIDAWPFDELAARLAPRSKSGEPLATDGLPGRVAMRERRPAHAEFQIQGLHGTRHWLEATAIPIERAGGPPLGALIMMWPGRMAGPR